MVCLQITLSPSTDEQDLILCARRCLQEPPDEKDEDEGLHDDEDEDDDEEDAEEDRFLLLFGRRFGRSRGEGGGKARAGPRFILGVRTFLKIIFLNTNCCIDDRASTIFTIEINNRLRVGFSGNS